MFVYEYTDFVDNIEYIAVLGGVFGAMNIYKIASLYPGN
jgi:hypothetical protein